MPGWNTDVGWASRPVTARVGNGVGECDGSTQVHKRQGINKLEIHAVRDDRRLAALTVHVPRMFTFCMGSRRRFSLRLLVIFLPCHDVTQ